MVVVRDVDVAIEGDGVVFDEVEEFAQVVVDADVLLERVVAVDGVEEAHLVAGDAEAGAGVGVALADRGGGGEVAGYGVVGEEAAELVGGGFREFVDDGGGGGDDFLDDIDGVFDAYFLKQESLFSMAVSISSTDCEVKSIFTLSNRLKIRSTASLKTIDVCSIIGIIFSERTSNCFNTAGNAKLTPSALALERSVGRTNGMLMAIATSPAELLSLI